MSLDNPLALVLMILALLLLIVFGAVSSAGVIFAYVPSLRDWVKEQIARLLRRP